jgi:hypothetical protein
MKSDLAHCPSSSLLVLFSGLYGAVIVCSDQVIHFPAVIRHSRICCFLILLSLRDAFVYCAFDSTGSCSRDASDLIEEPKPGRVLIF